MKIIILIIFFSLEVVESKGQEASEMEDIFQNGRRWNSMCEGVHAPWLDRTFFMVGYKYEGKKVVNGHYCSVIAEYTMDVDDPFNVKDDVLYSEDQGEGRKIRRDNYIYRLGPKYYLLSLHGEKRDELIFDFSVNKGDTIFRYRNVQGEKKEEMPYLVTEVGDTILEGMTDKRVRKYVHVAMLYSNSGSWAENDTWIEGIGSLKNGPIGSLFDNFMGSRRVLFKCFDDENIYYSNQTVPWDKNLILSIRNVEDTEADCNRNDGVQETYTLQGIKTDTPSKGIRIIRYSDGTVKKVYTR